MTCSFFCLSITEPLTWNFSTILCIVCFTQHCGCRIYIYIYFFENFWWLFYMTYLTKVCKWTHFIQQNVFVTCTALTPNTWLSTYLTSSAHEMRIVLCDSPVNTDIIFSYTLRAQMLRTVLVFINRWQEFIHPALLLKVVWPWFCSTVADGVWFEIRMRKA